MSPIHRRCLSAIAIATLSMAGALATAEDSLTVVSWGGSYATASVEGYHKAFTAETGIEIKLDDYNGGLALQRTDLQRPGPAQRLAVVERQSRRDERPLRRVAGTVTHGQM